MKGLHKQRFDDLRRRKNFFPTVILTLLFWILCALILFFVDPTTWLAVPIFFISLFGSVFFTFSILFVHTRRGFLVALAIISALFLRYLGVDTIYNFLLLLGAIVAFELYFSHKT